MEKRKISDYALLSLRGMAMGAADLIPGVSGGTIAFITGIYQEFIESIKSVDKSFFTLLFKSGIATAWNHINGTFLLSVFLGILFSIFTLARVISFLLERYPMLVWAFFFGLIIASAIHIGRKITVWNTGRVAAIILGAVLAAYITIASPASTPESWWFVFLSGSIAITAMILPGISGSFILLLLGKYQYMINAVKDHDFGTIILFGLGCVVGLMTFSRVISWLFKKYPNRTLAVLTGFMIGSLNKLWPWKEVVSERPNSAGELVPLLETNISPAAYASLHNTDPMVFPVILCAVFGFLLIFIFDVLSARKSKV